MTCSPHDNCNPDTCFAAKMRYWRQNGAPIAPVPQGWSDGPTVREQVKDTIEKAKINGYADQLSYKGRAELV